MQGRHPQRSRAPQGWGPKAWKQRSLTKTSKWRKTGQSGWERPRRFEAPLIRSKKREKQKETESEDGLEGNMAQTESQCKK